MHSQSKSVSENNKFMSDWKKSFVNLCKNLSWKKEIDFLKNTGLYDDEIEYYKPFCFEPNTAIISSINQEKALYFQLGHVLKDLYWAGRLDDAEELRKTMQSSFPREWKNEDPRLVSVISKLELPRFALKLLKKVKRIF